MRSIAGYLYIHHSPVESWHKVASLLKVCGHVAAQLFVQPQSHQQEDSAKASRLIKMSKSRSFISQSASRLLLLPACSACLLCLPALPACRNHFKHLPSNHWLTIYLSNSLGFNSQALLFDLFGSAARKCGNLEAITLFARMATN